MNTDYVRSYEQLTEEEKQFAHSLYHEQSKLGKTSVRGFVKRVLEQSASEQQNQQQQNHQVPRPLCYADKAQVELPSVSRWTRGNRLRQILEKRRSRRIFSATQSITLKQWSELLWFGCGVSERATAERPQSLRTWPAAGALYSVEVFPVVMRASELAAAIYHYDAEDHRLEVVERLSESQSIRDLIVCDFDLSQLESFVFLSVNIKRVAEKYGERGYRFALLEGGHVAQNILLMCEDLNLAAVPLGGFLDNAVATRLGLPTGHSPIYAIGVGRQEN
ncbi:MAG: SagB-type dehydrogenase family enzyme [Pirellulaceae bacterium]|jgi:SagB-type dehydrogenase family enzyme